MIELVYADRYTPIGGVVLHRGPWHEVLALLRNLQYTPRFINVRVHDVVRVTVIP